MPFEPKPGQYYRMPVFFGPMHGPRHWPADVEIDPLKTSKRVSVGVNFRTDKDVLEAILPSGFSLWGEPIVTVEITYLTEIGWLAGRGYNLCDVRFPAIYQTKAGPVHGTLVLIRWEDLADPILSGREELGHNKLWCEIPPLASLNGRHAATLSWLAFPFLKLAVSDLTEAPTPPANPLNKGTMSYKYIPRTGDWGLADVAYATMTPPTPNVRVVRRLAGKGDLDFLPTTWRDMPTQSYVIEALRAWPQREITSAYMVEAEGVANTEGTYILE